MLPFHFRFGLIFVGLLALPIRADDAALAKAKVGLEAVRRLKGVDFEGKPALKAAVNRLTDQFQGQPEFVELVRDFHLTNRYPALFDYTIAHPTEPAAGDALRTLLAVQPALVSAGLANTNQAPVLVSALGATRQREAVPLLLPLLTNSAQPNVLRRATLRALVTTQDGATEILKLAAEGQLPEDLKPLAATELKSVRWAAVKAEAAKILPPPPAPTAQGATPLPPVAELLKRTGDAVNGARMFRRPEIACISCHQINGEGVDFGPKLSEIGTKLGKDALYDAILEPSAGISFGYEAWAITFKNGDEVLGLLASETEDEIAVKIQGGLVTKYKKASVAKRELLKQSLMPEGLAANLTPPELIDLVEYLASLKKSTN